MSLCQQCVNLDAFEDQNFKGDWGLKNSRDMSNSAKDGCEGCQFFLGVIAWKFKDQHAMDVFICRAEPISIKGYGHRDFHILTNWDAFTSATVRLTVSLCLAAAEFDYAYNPGTHGPLRPIPKDPSTMECLKMALAWFEECSAHADCAKPFNVQLPSRLLDVGNDINSPPRLHITQPGDRGLYLTLSHCWGAKVKFIMDTRNLEQLKQAVDFDILPKNFQDAIIITRRLGFQYLWIDALCIIQDSQEDWVRESSQMAQIYSNGALMLSAMAAPDGERGMLTERHVLRSHQFGCDKRYVWQRPTEWTSDGIESPRPLDERAWAYQEYMLAPRILFFDEDKMRWECPRRNWVEDSGLGHITIPWAPKRRAEEFLRHPPPPSLTLQHFRPWKGAESNIEWRLQAFYDCVGRYSARKLTKQTDKLPAFSGMATAFRVPELGAYIAGLWEADIIYGLAWRVHHEDPQEQAVEDDEYIAPSWSWASVTHSCNMNSTRHMLFEYNKYSEREPWPAHCQLSSKGFQPRLISYDCSLSTSDPYGRLSAASIVLHGYCRSLILHTSETGISDIKDGPARAYLDRGFRKGYRWKFGPPHEYMPGEGTSVAEWPLENQYAVKQFTAFQVGLKAYNTALQGPKLAMLILKNVKGYENRYKRVGYLELTMEEEEMVPDRWEGRNLEII